MTPGMQELIAIAIVIGVVIFALWRRKRRVGTRESGCTGCDAAADEKSPEKPIRLYRRQD